MKSHQLQQFARLITTAMIALCLMIQSSLAQRAYEVGISVCDTIDTETVSRAPGGCELPEDYLEFVHAPYVTGLSFQMIITETSGRVRSDLSDSVKVGDVFTIPDVSVIPDTLRYGLRIHFGISSSFGFVTRIIGTPTVAYESYYSILEAGMTTNVCRNIYLYSADRGEILHVQPPVTVKERDNGTIPARFHLLQNYPNPFNASTNFEFDLPRATEVNLKIFTLEGEEVATLLNQSKFAAGSHRVNWNARNLPSGVYIYRLQTNNGFVAVRKLVLLK